MPSHTPIIHTQSGTSYHDSKTESGHTSIPMGQYQYKLSLYADALSLYVMNPHVSLPSNVKKFGLVSNFKVNYDSLYDSL